MAKKLQVHGNLRPEELDSAKIKEMVDDYLEENPPAPQITINGEKPDENGNFVIKTQPSDDNNVVEF